MEREDGKIQQFLSVYRITPNLNTVSGMSPAKLMFARKTNFQQTIASMKTKSSNTRGPQNISGLEIKFSSGCSKVKKLEESCSAVQNGSTKDI